MYELSKKRSWAAIARSAVPLNDDQKTVVVRGPARDVPPEKVPIFICRQGKKGEDQSTRTHQQSLLFQTLRQSAGDPTLTQTEKMNPETIQKGYDKYKKDWENRQHEEFIS